MTLCSNWHNYKQYSYPCVYPRRATIYIYVPKRLCVPVPLLSKELTFVSRDGLCTQGGLDISETVMAYRPVA